MKNEDRIIELLAETVKGQDRLIDKVSEMSHKIPEMTQEISEMNSELKKQGLQTAENSRAILKLADEIRLVA